MNSTAMSRTEAVETLREFTSLDGNIAEINLRVKPNVYICIYLRTYIFHTRNQPHPIYLPANSQRVLLTGFVATKAWLLATAVRWMIVTIELHTNEKNKFLCKVIRWQLKLLQGKINNVPTIVIRRNSNKVHFQLIDCSNFEKKICLSIIFTW